MLLLVALAIADEPDSPRARSVEGSSDQHGGFVVQVWDDRGLMGPSAEIELTDSEGMQTLQLVDDGENLDEEAQDGRWTGVVSQWSGSEITVGIETEDGRWEGSGVLDGSTEHPVIEVSFGFRGELQIGSQTGLREEAPEVQSHTRAQFSAGWWYWLALFGVAGTVCGGLVFRASQSPRVRPASLDGPVSPRVPPTRLEASRVAAALEEALSGFRVVVLGPVPEGVEVYECTQRGPLPEELVLAVEALAACSGAPPALLVTAPERLDRQGPGSPAEQLAQRVDQRFPLWVVGGPSGWRSWPDAGEE